MNAAQAISKVPDQDEGAFIGQTTRQRRSMPLYNSVLYRDDAPRLLQWRAQMTNNRTAAETRWGIGDPDGGDDENDFLVCVQCGAAKVPSPDPKCRECRGGDTETAHKP